MLLSVHNTDLSLGLLQAWRVKKFGNVSPCNLLQFMSVLNDANDEEKNKPSLATRNNFTTCF